MDNKTVIEEPEANPSNEETAATATEEVLLTPDDGIGPDEEIDSEETVGGDAVLTQEETETQQVSQEETATVAETQSDSLAFLHRHRIPVIIVFVLIIAALCAAIVIMLKKRKKPAPISAAPLDYPPEPPQGAPNAFETAPTLMPKQGGINAAALPLDATQPTVPIAPAPQPVLSNGKVNILSVQNIGNRPNQEDSFGFSDIENEALVRQKGVLGVVADGMGGLAGGEDVSSLLVEDMIGQFSERAEFQSAGAELDLLLKHAVQEVNDFLTRTVGLKKSGSTLMAVICKDYQLSWVSVGDSRIELFRNGKITTLNQQHVYGAELDEMVRQGKLSAQEAQSNTHRGELTSYVGMGELKYVDRSVRPLTLQAGDKVMLMSDGVFNALSDEEIASILQLPSGVISQTLEEAVLSKRKKYQDNFTALIIEI